MRYFGNEKGYTVDNFLTDLNSWGQKAYSLNFELFAQLWWIKYLLVINPISSSVTA